MAGLLPYLYHLQRARKVGGGLAFLGKGPVTAGRMLPWLTFASGSRMLKLLLYRQGGVLALGWRVWERV